MAITQFRVFKLVVSDSVFVFYNRKRFDRLGQYGQFFSVDTDFTHLGSEYESFYTDKVTKVQQTFEHSVVHFFVFIRADVITGDIHLDTAF